jgi:hypothetical protein
MGKISVKASEGVHVITSGVRSDHFGGQVLLFAAKGKTSYLSHADLESPEDKRSCVIEQAESGDIGKT